MDERAATLLAPVRNRLFVLGRLEGVEEQLIDRRRQIDVRDLEIDDDLREVGAESVFTGLADRRSVLRASAARFWRTRTASVSQMFMTTTSKAKEGDRKSTRLNSSHSGESRMPSSA